MNYRLVIEDFRPSDVNRLVDCVQSCFPAPRGEIMARILNIMPEDYLSYTQRVCEKAVKDSMSVVARNIDTDEIAGFCINEDFVGMPSYQKMDISPKFGALLAILDELDEEYRTANQPNRGEIFHCYMLGVNEKYQGQNLGRLLTMASAEKAKSLGYRSIVAEATGVISQKLCHELGFKVVAERSYQSFRFSGETPFIDIQEPRVCVLVERKFD